VAEVSQSSLRYDRETKLIVYALAGIPEYWILNLVARQLEVYREPAGSTYGSRTVLRLTDEVSPLFAPRRPSFDAGRGGEPFLFTRRRPPGSS
jgi:Uma2 family endonuclease